jgi:acyl-CoA synthetase (AMP-forming)/AMP-acid ligase II
VRRDADESVFETVLGRTGDSDRRCIVGDRPGTYGDLRSAVERLTVRLRAAGCVDGSRVAICLDQGFEYMAALLAVRAARGVSVLMAPDWTETEKARVLGHAECRLAITDTPVVGDTEPLRLAPLDGCDGLLLEFAQRETETAIEGDAVIIYTSGTTGMPKGVVLTDAGISANVRAVASYLELGPEDFSPVFTPTCYAYSLSQNLTHLWAGGGVLPLPSGLMFPLDLLQGVSIHSLTGISGTPTSFRILSQLDLEPGVDLSSIRYLMTGGQYLDARLVGLLGSMFPRARVVNMYGASENSPRISYHYVDGADGMDSRQCFSVGSPVAGTQIRVGSFIGKATDGQPVGEVLISGTSLMRGYWKDPAATAERLVDGWFHTRDLGYLDDAGRLFLTGRQSTIINIGNEKVSPEEVEMVLAEMPGIVDAAVYGVADPLLGESVHALVVLDSATRVQVADVQRHCRDRISGYKIPRRINVVDAVPRTLYGKIDRARLREQALS